MRFFTRVLVVALVVALLATPVSVAGDKPADEPKSTPKKLVAVPKNLVQEYVGDGNHAKEIVPMLAKGENWFMLYNVEQGAASAIFKCPAELVEVEGRGWFLRCGKEWGKISLAIFTDESGAVSRICDTNSRYSWYPRNK